MPRQYKDYQIVGEWEVTVMINGEPRQLHSIQELYDQDTKERFKPSELPIWDGTNLPGYIVTCRVGDPYEVDCGANGTKLIVDVSAICVFPNGAMPYVINLPRNGWLVCEYEFARSNDWQ